MKRSLKMYETPSTEVVEVNCQSIVCQSSLDDLTNYGNGGNPFPTETSFFNDDPFFKFF